MGRLDEVARKRIDRWRRSSRMTQAALASKIGRNPVWISRYLDNAYDADLDTLATMAAAFGRTLTELLGEDAIPTDENEMIERFRSLESAQRDLAMRMLRSWTPGVEWPSSEPPRGSSSGAPPAGTGKARKPGNRRSS
jgi:transcriptional regulator with XRE-family HTH domain